MSADSSDEDYVYDEVSGEWLPAAELRARAPAADPDVVEVRDSVGNLLADGDQVTVGELVLDVYHCPGHTPGHVVFHHAPSQLAIVGDVLFQGSIGRTDFPKGNFNDLVEAITTKLWPLGNETAFVPGHLWPRTPGQCLCGGSDAWLSIFSFAARKMRSAKVKYSWEMAAEAPTPTTAPIRTAPGSAPN